MGNSLLRSSEYKEMKKLTKKNTVINSSIPPIMDDFKPESPMDKGVSFGSSVSVLHFDVEDGEIFGDVITESVYDPYDTDSAPQPVAAAPPLANNGPAPSPVGSGNAAPVRQLKPTDSIVVAKLKKPANDGGGSPLAVRGAESPAANGRR
jgi:hypothetical protein